jgi:hypothetical protein
MCVVREGVVVMRKKYFKRMGQQPSLSQHTRHKPLLLIRPRGFSLELDNILFVRRLSPSRIPTLKSVLRIVLNLFSVLVVMGATWFLVSEALIYAYPGIKQPTTIKPPICANINRCAVPILNTSTPPVVSEITQVPSPAVLATSTPTARPTKTPMPKPSPDPTLPPTAYLSVKPVPLTISLVSICDKGQSTVLKLTNTGGTPLVWFQNTTNSSSGIKISDPTRTHLLQPGKSVNAIVNCLATLVVGLYKLVINYNGGVVNVAVKIKL